MPNGICPIGLARQLGAVLARALALSFALGACGAGPGARAGDDGADVVFHNAVLLTMNPERPRAGAGAVAVRGERIVAVGASLDELIEWVDDGTVIQDLDGRTLIPGLNDTHIHVRDLGFEQHYAVNLQPAQSIADVQRMLRERLEALQREGRLGGWRYPTGGEEGPWLFGVAWTQDRLAEKRMANRHELDAVSREVPIALERIYRGVAVNTRVFELLGIDFADPSTWPAWFREDPANFEAGDVIFRDPQTGLPNGVFTGERAPRLVRPAIPEKSFEQRVESHALGLEVLASYGITGIVEAGSRLGEVTRVYQTLHDRGRMPVRVVVYDGWYRSGDPDGLGDPAAIRDRLETLGFHNLGDDRFRVRGAKSSADGGVGSRSAAVSVPFLPVPGDPLGAGNYGALREPDMERRTAQLRALADHGWELHTHAIGDVAIRQTVDVYKLLMDSIRAERPDADLRWSIIHNYMPDEPGNSVIREMAEYGIIAAINPANLFYEGDSFVRNIGEERMARHTPYRTFLEAGVLMASGSDYPNNSADPWAGIYNMITRRHQQSGNVYGADQTIPLEEALATFTINAAYLTYDEDVRGSITPGKYADLVVLDADLTRASEEEILDMAARTLLTMVGGEVVYRQAGFALGR